MNLKAMGSFDLINHGWTSVNIDGGWQGYEREGKYGIVSDETRFPAAKGKLIILNTTGGSEICRTLLKSAMRCKNLNRISFTAFATEPVSLMAILWHTFKQRIMPLAYHTSSTCGAQAVITNIHGKVL